MKVGHKSSLPNKQVGQSAVIMESWVEEKNGMTSGFLLAISHY